jgi:zinc protease
MARNKRTTAWFSTVLLTFLLFIADSSLFAQEVFRATLSNGLRLVVIRDTLAPVVTTVVNYLVGSNESPPGFPGMAHAQEHMMFRGSPGLSAEQLAAIATEMGGNFNADTRQSVTQYFFTVPANELEVALRVESIRMSGVLDTEGLWKDERGAIDQEVAQDLSNPEYLMYSKLLAAMFKGTVYAHDALGTRESFQKTTGAMLRDFHGKWYAPNNAILVVAGLVDPPAVLQQVKRLFGAMPSKRLPAKPGIRFSPVAAQNLKMTTDSSTGTSVIAFRLPGSQDPDFAAVQVLSDVLSSQRGSLYQLAVDGRALFAEFALNSLPKASLGYAVAGFPSGGDGEKLVERMKGVIRDVKDKGVPLDLVEAAKRRELAGAEFFKNSISGLAMLWSEALAVDGLHSPRQALDAIEKVTKADVDRVAAKYLVFDQSITAVLTPQPSSVPVSAKGFGGAESPVIAPSGPVKLPSWARQALGKLSVPAFTLSPTVSVLSNGIKLIVQPETVSNTVSLVGRVQTNPYLQVPEGKEGLSSIMDSLFEYGTVTLDRIAFRKALDDIAADASAGPDFSLQVLSPDFLRGLGLLADNVLHPAFPEAAFGIIQRQTADSVAGRLQSPGYRLGRAADAALLPPGDPALRQTTPATVRSVTLQDVKDYYDKVMRPDMTTIVVVGNIDPGDAKKAIEDAFGGWKAEGPKPQVLLAPIPPNKGAIVNVEDPSRVQDQVTLTESVELTWKSPDWYALELGNRVLGGGFYASRLYRDLREKTGLVYYVGSSLAVGRTRSFYSLNFGCDPDNVSKATAIIRDDLTRMQTTPVTAEELTLAKALLLREAPLSEAGVRGIAGGLMFRSINGLPLDEPAVAAGIFLSLTAEQVREAFAKWLRVEDFVQASEGPPPR